MPALAEAVLGVAGLAIYPPVLVVVGVLTLCGGLTVRFGLLLADAEGKTRRDLALNRAQVFSTVNRRLILTEALLGVVALILVAITGGQNLGSTIVIGVALLVMPAIVASYLYGVVLASRGDAARRDDQDARRLVSWSWYSMPLTYGLWLASVLVMAASVPWSGSL